MESPHASHRPQPGQDPAEAARHAPISFGQLYPVGDILSVIPDRSDAERAVQELQEAGVPKGDIDLVDGAWFVEAVKQIEEHRNPLQRVLALLNWEEREILQEYVEHGQQGHSIVVVHADQPDVCGRVTRILAQHGATAMRHYGPLVITDLV